MKDNIIIIQFLEPKIYTGEEAIKNHTRIAVLETIANCNQVQNNRIKYNPSASV